MSPKPSQKRSGQGTLANSKSKPGIAADGRKGGKPGLGGGSSVVEGGAMATAVVQKKAVGGVSAGVEAQVRLLLQELSRQELLHHHRHRVSKDAEAGATPRATAAAAPLPVDSRTLVAFSDLWDQLLSAGFSLEHVKRVVQELPRTSQPSLDAALDWLCLYLPPGELPARFRAAGAGGGGGAPVRILALAQQQQQQPQPGEEEATAAAATEAVPSDRAWDDSGSEAGVEAGAAGGAAGKVAAAEAEAKAGGGGGGGGGGGEGGGMKEWILRYMDEQASSGDDGDEAGSGGHASSCSSIADFEWEVWGDPREVARRRAERARSRLGPEERRRQLAEEWGRAKDVAARAKATGDKARQKDAGLMIRDLKQEMAALGVTELQLEAIAAGKGLPPSGAAAAHQAAVATAIAGSGMAVAGDKGSSGAVGADKCKTKGKDKEKDNGKEKHKDKGKDKDKDKDKDKEKSRRPAVETPPPEAESESPSEPEPEPEPAPEPPAASRRAAAPEPEDDVVPDSWEERDPGDELGASLDGADGDADVGLRSEAAYRGGGADRLGAQVGPQDVEIGPERQANGGRSSPPEADEEGPGGAGGGGGGGGQGGAGRGRGDDGDEAPSFGLFDGEQQPAPSGRAPAESASAEVTAAAAPTIADGGKAGAARAEDADAFTLPGLFDEDGGGGGGADSAPTAPPSTLLRSAADAPGPSGDYCSAAGRAGGGKGGKKGGGKAAPSAPAAEAPRTPRALLSQLCQKQAWSQPRFERLAVPDDVPGPAFRYNVVLDLGPARGLAKKRNLYGVRVYSIPVRQRPDGPPVPPTWTDPSTAQDAAAARALYDVAPPLQLQQSLFQSLAPEWRQLWLEWEAADGTAAAVAAAGAAGAAAAAAGTAIAAAKQAEEDKLAVLRELLSRPPPPPTPYMSALPRPASVTALQSTAAQTGPGEDANKTTAPELPEREVPEQGPTQVEQPVETAGEEAEEAAEEEEEAAAEAEEAAAEEAEEVEEEMDEEEEDLHAEPISHPDNDAVEQEEWEDMVAVGAGVQEEQEEEQQQEGVERVEAEMGTQVSEGSRLAATEAVVGTGGGSHGGDKGAAREDQDNTQASRDAATAAAAESATGAALRAATERWQSSPAGQAMAAARSSLPIAAIRGELLAVLAEGDVVVVSGDTGCGKTTQVPQYLLEEAIASGAGGRTHVVVTQPRRIAAISVAERVADERGEPPPGSPGPASTTGYHVRLGAAVTRHTRLTFCTTGILLRRLAGDPALSGITHVVVDEVHERSLQSDFLIALLRDLLAVRKQQRQQAAAAAEAEAAAAAVRGGGGDGGAGSERLAAPPPRPPPPALKVVLMSATLDAKLFAGYFGGCPVLTAAGRTFPVSRLFLEDVYEATGYCLASDAPAALRRHGPGAAVQYSRRHAGGSRSQRDLVSRGFGDEEALAAPLNPEYDPQLYGDRPLHVRRNLARVDEHRIDYDVLEALLSYIDATTEPGAVLVFLSGIGEINHLYDRLTAQRAYSTRGAAAGARCVVLPLHSAVPPAGQRAALRPPPPGLRKVVLATNIAETSLTIEDVVAVVDTGRHKERRFNPARSMSMLVEDWVSAASAQQRAGRAGRVRPGVSYATYTRARFEGGLRRYGAPEITRVPLEELVLQILLMGLGPVSDFLSRVLEPPQPRAVTAALEVLRQVGALETAATANTGATVVNAQQQQQQQQQGPYGPLGPQVLTAAAAAAAGGVPPPAGASTAAAAAAAAAALEVLSPLGRHLALLPVAPRLGKLLVVGALLGCLAPAVTIAATMSHKSPFLTPTDDRSGAERARRALAAPGGDGIAAGQQSDHLLLVAAYELWRVAASPKYGGGAKTAALTAKRHFLHLQTLEQLAEMRCQLAVMLADARLVQPAAAYGSGGGGGYGDGDGGGGHGKAAMAAAAAWLDDPRAPWNRFAGDPLVVKAALCAALSPAVAVMGEDSSPTCPPRWTDAAPGAGAGEEVFVHPSSVVASLNTPQLHHPYLVYLEKVKTARLFLRDVTAVSPLSLMLFGSHLTVQHAEGAVLVGSGSGTGAGGSGGGVRIACRAQTAVLVKQLRGALNQLLERRFTGTGGGGGGGGGGAGGQVAEAVVATVRQMLREEDELRAVAARLS